MTVITTFVLREEGSVSTRSTTRWRLDSVHLHFFFLSDVWMQNPKTDFVVNLSGKEYL